MAGSFQPPLKVKLTFSGIADSARLSIRWNAGMAELGKRQVALVESSNQSSNAELEEPIIVHGGTTAEALTRPVLCPVELEQIPRQE